MLLLFYDVKRGHVLSVERKIFESNCAKQRGTEEARKSFVVHRIGAVEVTENCKEKKSGQLELGTQLSVS